MKSLLEKFYSAFSMLDAPSMIDCYHENIEFWDPAFGSLKDDRAKSMWAMLCSRSKDLRIDYKNIQVNGNRGKVDWEAFYTFSQTGKRVHNIITAEFEFKDDKIIKHTDNFDLHNWAKQALGFKGLLLGKTEFFKKKLNQQTNRLLDYYIQNNA